MTNPDPTTQYPQPPFPRQPQDAPGSVNAMTPVPDHGEHSYRGTGRLAGRKALITGGDSGIGRAAAIAFAREGADVAINYLPAEESDAQEVVTLIRAAGRKAVALPGDITSETFCTQLVEQAVKELGGLDILVNNAGKQQFQENIADLTTEQFDLTFRTNVYAMFWITKAAMPHLKPGASIINTSSIQARKPSKNLLDYASTKAAIVAFTEALAQQVAPHGVRVNAVAPGYTATPLTKRGLETPEWRETWLKETPMGRLAEPAEIAPAVVYLASRAASFVTGHTLVVDGGYTAW